MDTRPPSNDPANTIYYLITETPHLNDFSVLGPFPNRQAMSMTVLNKLRDAHSLKGMEDFANLVEDPGISTFTRIEAPIQDGSGNTMSITLHKEYNAAVKATLPGSCWLVLEAEIDKVEQCQTRLDVFGTYTTKEAANRAVRLHAEDMASSAAGWRIVKGPVTVNGCMQCYISGPKTMSMVVVRYESGQVSFRDNEYV